MRKFSSALALAALLAGASVSAMAAPQYMTADHGMRTSRMMGTAVFNDQNVRIGEIEDVILPAAGGEVSLVLSLDPAFGAGAKMVKVPLSHVHLGGDKATMPATKAEMAALPAFQYYTGGGGG